MKYSNHARLRMRQRSFDDADVEYVVEHGVRTSIDGSLLLFEIVDSPFVSIDADARRTRNRGRGVLLGPDGTVVTVFPRGEPCLMRKGA